MVNDRIILIPQDILEKEFKVDAIGLKKWISF